MFLRGCDSRGGDPIRRPAVVQCQRIAERPANRNQLTEMIGVVVDHEQQRSKALFADPYPSGPVAKRSTETYWARRFSASRSVLNCCMLAFHAAESGGAGFRGQ